MTPPSVGLVPVRCLNCTEHHSSGIDFTMAFQPIIDCKRKQIFGYEALVRGCNNESAFSVLSKVTDKQRYHFDQHCRVKAISLASQLGLSGVLSINFLPNAIYRPERCIQTTLEAARRYQFPVENIMFEFTENEQATDSKQLMSIIECYTKLNLRTAIDDFGAGYSGLNLLADFQTDLVKLDMALIRHIHKDRNRQIIVKHTVDMLRALNIEILAEGVETKEEYDFLKTLDIDYVQGYYFAHPGFESLPEVDLSLI
ncbi:MAG: Blue light- and temperature-regulated antirepressor BluF [Candidatus Erwinia impunctatus]|nr:Blue light- and temperature-regulated antirepressor BluF [Culicoides impunctatus]